MNLSPVSPDQSTSAWATQVVAWPLAPEVSTFGKVFQHILQLSLTEEDCNRALQSFSDLDLMHIRSFADLVVQFHDEILKRMVAREEISTPRAEDSGHANIQTTSSSCNKLSSPTGGDEYGSELSSPPNSDSDQINDEEVVVSSPPSNSDDSEKIEENSRGNSVVSNPTDNANEAEQISEEEVVVSSPRNNDNDTEKLDEEETACDSMASPHHEGYDTEQIGETPVCAVDAIEQSKPSTDISSTLCQTLLSQTDNQFAHDSYRQIERLRLNETPETCQGLLEALQSPPQEHTWSDGSQWANIIETGDGNYRIASIRTAIRSAAYAQWHESQASYLERTKDMKTKEACRSVFERVVGHKPQEPGPGQKEWKRRRQRLSLCHTRGKKWLRLVNAFGSGILFKDVWALVKSREEDLTKLLDEVIYQKGKMDVLRLLTKQLEILSNTGRTDPEEFQTQLKSMGYEVPGEKFTTTNDENLDNFIKEVRGSTTSDKLFIPQADFQFDVTALERFGPQQLFNDGLLLACLHLSTRMPYLRIGVSVPIHRQTPTRGGSLLPDPFQRASALISEHREDHKGQPLVWLFPLFQRGNHFSLLEINDGNRRIYHYDSMGGPNDDIKKACEEEFTEFEYIEQNVVQQHDSHSCGPLVIRNARDRMVGRCVAESSTQPYEPEELRAEALEILQKAWKDGVLIGAPEVNTGKKRKSTRNGAGGPQKRRKSRQEVVDLTS